MLDLISCLASSWLMPFFEFQASHLALPCQSYCEHKKVNVYIYLDYVHSDSSTLFIISKALVI